MSESQEKQPSAAADRRWFATTHWSVVLSARNRKSAQPERALAAFFWFPMYAYVRRSSYSSHDAQDAPQEIFAWLLEKDFLKNVDHSRGKFRSFLLAALKHLLSNQREQARTWKRGRGRVSFSLDFEGAENRYRLEPEDPTTPERLY